MACKSGPKISILVSVDDHLVEPPDLFDGHIPAKYRDRAPEGRPHQDDGADVWVFEGAVIPNIGLNAVAGRPKEEYGIEPTAFDEIRPGCWDVDERVKDMNAGGVLGSMCFPSFPGFCGRLFAAVDDKDLALAVVQAYNDWHIDEWCGAYPGRFIPMGLPVLWDPELAAAEVRRLAGEGRALADLHREPGHARLPELPQRPLGPARGRRCATQDVVLSIHLGSSGKLAVTAPDAPIDVMITLQPMNICAAAADLLWSRVLKEFPDIRIALSEGGTGWIPYFLDRLDRTYDMHHLWTGQDFGDRLPERGVPRALPHLLHRRPGRASQLRDDIGIDNIAWECDYPHSDSSWPEAPEELAEVARSTTCPTPTSTRSATRTPCAGTRSTRSRTSPKEQCTVGALRAEAEGHDVSIRSFDKGRFERTHKGIEIGKLASKATA